MPLQIIRNDITKMECGAIVNAANESLLGGGGVDGMIHRAAGAGLLAECRTLGGCKTGKAKITGAYELPCRYVIHTVGPRWRGGKNGEKELLESCYRECLGLAEENGLESIAFPLISSGAYGYPKDQALQVAVDTISSYLLHSNAQKQEMQVFLVVYDKACFQISQKLKDGIREYIDEHYVEEHTPKRCRPDSGPEQLDARQAVAGGPRALFREKPQAASKPPAPASLNASVPASVQEYCLEEVLKHIDESFSQMLLRKIDEKGMTDAECYKKANIDRKLFSKIRNNIHYKPSKITAIAFAIALELPLAEAKDMLMKAGFALSHSNKFDIIIEYFIQKQNYNIFEINEALFAFDQSLLGA